MKKILYSILAVVMGVSLAMPVMASEAVYADCDYQGAILDYCGEDGGAANGGGIKHILSLVVRVMTVGIGILAVIGVTVAGIQYITAGGNEERTRKSKRRIFEIVIGILAYVLIFAVLDWLIPEFNPFG